VGTQKVVALDQVDLYIPAGEICCILGTSGSGKSTLLHLMAGLEKPTRGTIQVHGISIEKLTEQQLALFRQKYIGFVFQSYNLLPSLSALDNVSLPLVFKGVPKRQRDFAAAEMLDLVGLKQFVKHKPTEMSGGQQQRVGIARAFVGKPPIILADEPTGNLDSRVSMEIMQLMLGLAKEHQQTLVLITHDRDIAAFAHRIIHFLDGNIAQEQIMQLEERMS
jgi:putative ABC transport system ATP-binding protein